MKNHLCAFREQTLAFLYWDGAESEQYKLTDFCGLHWSRADVHDIIFPIRYIDDPSQLIVYNHKLDIWLPVPIGFYIVKGIEGELYSFPPDLFSQYFKEVI